MFLDHLGNISKIFETNIGASKKISNYTFLGSCTLSWWDFTLLLLVWAAGQKRDPTSTILAWILWREVGSRAVT